MYEALGSHLYRWLCTCWVSTESLWALVSMGKIWLCSLPGGFGGLLSLLVEGGSDS